jgi:hypothetical protein
MQTARFKWIVSLAIVLVVFLLVVGPGTAFGATAVDSPGKVQPDTIQLNWTGQGTANGAFDQKCDNAADPGSGGYQNGADATNYMLWIFNTANGSVAGNVTLTINGTTYGNNDGHQIVTPAYDPTSITAAHTNFVVASTGKGSWVLTISHGCGGTVEEQVDPTGKINGPCADPAYYATMDNARSTMAISFRMRWYNMKGLNGVVISVPAGSIYTTWQHWAKPGTYVSVWYKDPFTLVWKLLDRVLAIQGSYPPCDVQPGFSPVNP